jgi:hypothetical protein
MRNQEWKAAFSSGYGSGVLGTSRCMRSLAAALLVLVAAGTSAAMAAAPPNDNFVSAISVTSLPFSDQQSTVDATTEPDDPDCYGQGHTVWYTFTPATDMRITANTFGSDYDTILGLYTGEPGSFTEVACNDDFQFGLQSQVRFDASAGETYFFMVGACCGASGGNLVLSIQEALPPANDDFGAAIVADSLPFSDTLVTQEATRAGDDPTDCFDWQPTVWYAFTPAEDMQIWAYTAASDHDTMIGVYTGERGSLALVACSNFATAPLEVVAGETYFLMVGPTYGEGGFLTFSIQEVPPALQFDVRLDRFSSFDPRTGQAVVRGTATCNQPTLVSVSGTLEQRVGRRFTISGSFGHSFDCNGTMPWKATVVPQSGQFRGGRAKADVHAFAQAQFDSLEDDASATVTLRGGKRR